MKPSDYLKTYMRNSINPDRFRPYIPGYAWPTKYYPDVLKQQRKQTLCIKEYKRIINRKRNRCWRPVSMRATKKLLHKMHPKRLNPLYREAQMKGTFYQPPYEQLKWSFIDFPDPIKEYLYSQAAIQSKSMPVITTDMPPAIVGFVSLEQSYLASLKDKSNDGALLPIERATSDKIARLIEGPDGIIRFENGHKISVPYPTLEDGKALGTLDFIYEDITDE